MPYVCLRLQTHTHTRTRSTTLLTTLDPDLLELWEISALLRIIPSAPIAYSLSPPRGVHPNSSVLAWQSRPPATSWEKKRPHISSSTPLVLTHRRAPQPSPQPCCCLSPSQEHPNA
ncbi:hypothetical protein CPLU01_07526 [Colletotrichum plurivorum]|uniref:Uncharacterized protein n=1 Tax=Colletotrichum plurivorum TaxID=2175906 RepID=A0A8H6KG52_9PEZI|nr:hypothetical protein CPLU01_07526 [Colletotrichum plurivorum]